jgi:hypothetical protein
LAPVNAGPGQIPPEEIRISVMRLARLALVALALVFAAAPFATAGSGFPPLKWRSGAHGFYDVPLPASWRFKNASEPSDHATYLWFDPTNPLRKLRITISGCVGCVSTHNYTVSYPQGELPPGVTSTYRISPGKLAFTAYSTDDPYPDSGVVIVTRHDGAISGSIILQLWLPDSEHKLATYILDNFAARGHNG